MATDGGLLSKRELNAEEQQKKERLLNAGHAAFDQEQYPNALECYHRASLIDGADAEVWSALGLTYANLDLPREAWRSYKLALASDETRLDTLWYAAEFLYNAEDFALAKVLLERYVALEGDALRRAEAEEMLADTIREIGDDDEIRARPGLAPEDETAEELGEERELEGFEIDEEDQLDSDWDDDDEYDAEAEHFDEEAEEEFVASLQLELSGMAGKCRKCGIGIPLDAPYCYNCLAPHIYGEN